MTSLEPMTRPMTAAVILAGGFGTRLQGVLENLPKPMAPVAGRPFIEWIVAALHASGIERVALSTGYLAEKVADHFSQETLPGGEIVCVPEESPLGTAGGFLNAAAKSGFHPESWLVCNGDSLVAAPLYRLFSAFSDRAVDVAVMALWQEDASRYGSLDIAPDGRLRGFMEKRPGQAWINAGVYLFRSELLEGFPSRRPLSFETDVFPGLLAAGKCIRAVKAEGDFLDIGLPESLGMAPEFVQRNRKIWGN